MSKKRRVIVLYGGRSAEHEVSKRSAAFVLRNLDPQRYDVVAIGIDKGGHWFPQDTSSILAHLEKEVPLVVPTQIPQSLIGSDVVQMLSVPDTVVFPVLHGTYGEDGTLQGLLETIDVAYVGSNHLGSSVGMDKDIAKRLVKDAGVPVVPWLTVRVDTYGDMKEKVATEAQALGFPLFVKPANLGSSVGISKVTKQEDLDRAIHLAFDFDTKVLIEKGLEVREIECAVLGGTKPRASIPGEVIPHTDFYSYEAKYLDAEAASLAIPADLSPTDQELVQNYAIRIFQALELYGLARVDLFLEKGTNSFYFNEVNTLPGFTEISQYPMLWQASGMSPISLVDELIQHAIDRHQRNAALKRSYS